ncbi:hypothetical protein EB796_019013 [Bugula neritina]|uniref:L-type lectin-like domain-containing protein n=1 Tax=Bugula neritina TaxID=10212 RepID=A0A7J7J9I2_BUGNE|nr:hypothetical protein EB796_019013 [Bugula neritina]
MRDYRNKPFATKAKVRYENKVLSMFLSSGLTKPTAVEDGAEHLYDLCAYIPNVELPGSGHFGVSAATGALADDHDIISFMAHSLRTEEEMKSKQAIADEERAKYDKEFEEYDKQLNEAKTEYQKENPEANAKEDEEEEFYDTGVKELKMIFDGQDHIHQSINAINRRLNELIGTSQQLATQIGQLAQQGAGVQQAGQVPAQPPATGTGTPAIQRHEVDHLIRNGNDLVQQLNQLKNSVEGIAREKRDAPPAPPSYEDQAGTQLIKNNVDEMKTILKQMQADAYVNSQKGGGASSCPEVSCLSTTYFGVFIVGQVVLLLLYSVYQSRKEAAAKKFY